MRYSNAEFNKIPEVIQKVIQENVKEVEKYNFYRPQEEATKTKIITKGLFLFGNTGSGKTYTLHAVKNRIGFKNVENWVELLFELKGKFNIKDGVTTLIDSLTESQYIFLDDVGAEKQSEWSQEMLYLIINRAYNYEKTLFITTNLDEKEFQDKYGDRIFDRIQEICSVIKMPKVNHRK